jgi:hypothetical protein
LCFPGNTFDFQASPGDIANGAVMGQKESEIGLFGLMVGRIKEIGNIHSHEGEDGLSFIGRVSRIPNEQAIFDEWEDISQARYPYSKRVDQSRDSTTPIFAI